MFDQNFSKQKTIIHLKSDGEVSCRKASFPYKKLAARSRFHPEISSSRYVSKSKNCSEFMKVDQILKVWSLLSPKIFISPE
jgi:hypothetical protein